MSINSSNTERDLLDSAAAIGGIAECNCHYTLKLANLIEQKNRVVNEMTLGELIALHNECNEQYNEMYK